MINRRDVLVGGAALGVSGATVKNRRLPTVFLPHGGGPCFFMPDGAMGPPGTWTAMGDYLKSIGTALPTPKAVLVISAHWEERVPTVITAAAPGLYYDYYGFPPETYQLTWPAPGSPALAARVRSLLTGAGIESAEEAKRGWDHGVFIPLKLSYPGAEIPTVQLSLKAGLDPSAHLQLGKALEPLRDEGVLIVGSGMSYHNMRGFNSRQAAADSVRFDAWLNSAAAAAPGEREAQLKNWAAAPAARACHPREEHLLPLMVVAGAAGTDAGKTAFNGEALGVRISAIQFG